MYSHLFSQFMSNNKNIAIFLRRIKLIPEKNIVLRAAIESVFLRGFGITKPPNFSLTLKNVKTVFSSNS